MGISGQLFVSTSGLVIPFEVYTAFLSCLEALGIAIDKASAPLQAQLRAALKRVNQKGSRLAATIFM